MQLRVPSEAFPQLRLRDCSELCVQMDGSNELRGFITPNATFETLLQSLINHEYWFDAVSLLAHGMPPRSSIWWSAMVCANRLKTADPEDASIPAQVQVIELSRQWVMEPKDDIRDAVHRATSDLPNSLPAYWTGMSVFWATGNITPDAGVVTQPPPYLYARAVSAAIDLAASLAVLDRIQVYELALASGIDIAQGGTGENESPAAS